MSEENSITSKTIGKIFQESAWNIEPTITILGVTYTAKEFNKAVEMLKQPQLNENQQSLITWMQDNECETNDPLESISDLFLEAEASSWETCLSAAYKSLTNREKAEMVQEYLKQYLEQEEE
ncbi:MULTISPECIES: hypothetical protein [Enterococcus]|uniref:hypothetical protein n=1 Tax=Enterococcus TaxID=1350 RepID=UPI0010FF6E57|nr:MULTISPECIES: hypothetical protein [Enterococcus]QCT92815.1 hypothetical protein FE005_13125 [Enterococcus sp. M190262]